MATGYGEHGLVLDFCGPFEVFSVANRFTDPPAFSVLTVSEKAGPVLTRGGLSINPHHWIADCPQFLQGGESNHHERTAHLAS